MAGLACKTKVEIHSSIMPRSGALISRSSGTRRCVRMLVRQDHINNKIALTYGIRDF